MKSRTIIILTAQLAKPAVSLLHFRSICRELTVVDQIRIEQKSVWSHVGAMLVPSWGQVGAMLGPCWGQVGAILGCASWLVSINFWTDFWRLLGAHVGAMLEAKTIKNRKKGDLESFL